MTEILARDGEGATKLLRITVEWSRPEEDARAVARSLVNSPLIKTMVPYGADPNVGRILMAVGKCLPPSKLAPERLDATIKGVQGGWRAAPGPPSRMRRCGPCSWRIPVDIGITMGGGERKGRGVGVRPSLRGTSRRNAAYYSS